MKRTILHNWHKEHGAKMVEFAGWEMPVQYTTIREEHINVREKAGLFDLSHMGRIRIRGRDRVAFIQQVFTNDLTKIKVGDVQYGLLCNPTGGVIDDITVYMADDYLMLVVNACNKDKVVSWLKANVGDFQADIEDASILVLMLAIQGPQALQIMYEMTRIDLSNIAPYQFRVQHLSRSQAVVSRTGYTGEDGLEIYIGSVYFQSLWEQLLEAGAKRGLIPIGLGARDTLRTESCLPLYGHELSEEMSPLDAGLARYVQFSKPDFIGKKALLHSTNAEFSKKLICFEMTDKAIPRPGCPIVFGDLVIGTVTSGTFSPTFQRGIGMAYIDRMRSEPETPIMIQINEKPHPAVIRKRPLYKRRKQT